MTEAASRLPRYEDAVRRFRIEDEIARLDGDPATAINAYVECCGRHTGGNRLALRAISAGGELREFTFDDLADMSGRAGNVLKDAGVRPGDVVAGLLPRIPELVALILGVWRVGAIYQPLFTAFGPKAIEHRLKTSSAKLVVTNPANRGKLVDRLKAKPLPRVRADAFPIEPNVLVDNHASNRFTVVEVNARDRPALLSQLAYALFQSKVTIHSAHVATYGERAVDTFYLTDLTGDKITAGVRAKALEKRLLDAAAGVPAELAA